MPFKSFSIPSAIQKPNNTSHVCNAITLPLY